MNLRCPECKCLNHSYNMLPSNPPQYEFICSRDCGFALRYFNRKDSRALITQAELDEFYKED